MLPASREPGKDRGCLPAAGPLGLSRGELFTTTAAGVVFCFMAWSISTSFSLSAAWEAEV